MKKRKDIVMAAVGILLLVAGLYLEKNTGASWEFRNVLPYVCIGIGCGIFGHGIGGIISQKAVQMDDELQKRLEIEAKDERNIAISNRAKAKGYDLMTAAFGALMVSFAIMGVEIIQVLMIVAVYLFVHGYAICYRIKYDREM